VKWLHIGLYVLALLLGCAVVFGGVLAHQEHQDRQRAAAEQERYGDVLAAARKEIEAFVNIDYTKAQESIDAVAGGATGDFAKQYDTSTKDVVKILTKAKSVMKGKVLWAGVVDADSDSASVIVATSGTVQNTSTGDKPVARQFRIKVDLVRKDDAWKTSNVEFVG
jgi:Mce-associated membrane protein